VTKWIDVVFFKPPNGLNVLILLNYNNLCCSILVGWYCERENKWYLASLENEDIDATKFTDDWVITHWTLMPEVPKEIIKYG
jgi:hypothetical protein